MANNLLQIDLLLTDTANLSFFYFPEHKKNKLPAAESQWSTNTQWDLSRYQIIQDENGQKAQTAAILSLVDFFGDWSVVAFYGQPLLPQYEKVLVLSPTPSIYFKEPSAILHLVFPGPMPLPFLPFVLSMLTTLIIHILLMRLISIYQGHIIKPWELSSIWQKVDLPVTCNMLEKKSLIMI